MVSDEAPGAGSRVAGYRLQEQIGQGGMAVVFRAQDERLDRLVALKVLAPALARDEQFRQRFVRESRAAAAVDDPHIIPIYEAGEADGALYIAMRYVRGGDVGTLVRRLGPLPPARAAAIISAVASALDAAHAAGLVHRDVKPANMLLDRQVGRPDHVYLSDFGLSKAWQGATQLTGTGLYLGTLDYSAPEQIEARPMDGRTDQYALACAAFELLAGEPPFRRDQPLAVMYAQVSAPPPLLTARRAGMPAAVDHVLARALAKSPADRYASCGELATELRGALGLPAYDETGEGAAPPRRAPTALAGTDPVEPSGRPPYQPPGGPSAPSAYQAPGDPSGRPPYQVPSDPSARPPYQAAGDPSQRPPYQAPNDPYARPPYQAAVGPTWPPAPGSESATMERGGPPGRRSRTGVLVAAVVAGLLVAGGAGAAIALSAAHNSPGSGSSPPPAQGGATHNVATQNSPSASSTTQSSPTQTPTQSASASASQTPTTVPLSQIQVCTFPADSCRSSDLSQMKSEPTQIVNSGDGSGYLKGLTWSSWGQPTAQGTGTLEIDNCNPNCAQGTFTGYPATVTLTNLTPYGTSGYQAYASMTINAPSSPSPTESFTSGLVP
jgi:serine/threonine-protein kinase